MGNMSKKADAAIKRENAKKFLPFVSGALIIILLAFFYFVIGSLSVSHLDIALVSVICVILGVLVGILFHIDLIIPKIDKKGESTANFIAGINCVILVIIIVVGYRAIDDVVVASYSLVSTILATVSVFSFFRSGIVGR
jgi:small-conductance mechanosensitive channel